MTLIPVHSLPILLPSPLGLSSPGIHNRNQLKRLTLHGSHTTMGEEDPTERFAPQQLILEPELAVGIVVLSEPEQNTGTLENGHPGVRHGVCEVVIDQRGDTSVRVDLEELGFLLVRFLERKRGEVVPHLLGAVGLDKLFEVDGRFEAVGGTLGVEVQFGAGAFGQGRRRLERGEGG